MSCFVFCLVSVIFADFSGGYSKNVTAEQSFRLCFYKKTQDPKQGFHVPVTAGVLVVCGAVCCAVVSGDDESMCLGPITEQDPGLVHARSWYSSVRPGSVCMYVLETSEGPAVSGWVSLRWLKGLNFKKERKKNSRTYVSNK